MRILDALMQATNPGNKKSGASLATLAHIPSLAEIGLQGKALHLARQACV
jgi:hypothetical protein